MSNLKSKVAQLETELIQLVLSKNHLTDKEINFKVNSIYRSTDSLKKLLNSLEDEPKQTPPTNQLGLQEPKKGRVKKQQVKQEPLSVCFAH